MSEDYSKWPREALFQCAFLLLERANCILETARIKHEEQRKELCYPIPVFPVGKPVC